MSGLNGQSRNLSGIDLLFQDGENNRVKQWKGVTPVKGVFGGELQLSEQPLLGDWAIVAEIGDEVRHDLNDIPET